MNNNFLFEKKLIFWLHSNYSRMISKSQIILNKRLSIQFESELNQNWIKFWIKNISIHECELNRMNRFFEDSWIDFESFFQFLNQNWITWIVFFRIMNRFWIVWIVFISILESELNHLNRFILDSWIDFESLESL